MATISTAAQQYWDAGWPVFELPAHSKGPPPPGRTGRDGVDLPPTAAQWAGNVAIRMPADVIGLDVDAYRGGLDTLTALILELGALPVTWISHSGRNDGSGIRFYRVPPGMGWVAGLAGIDIIQRDHRYAAVWPSTHPDGRQYGWWDQNEDAPADQPPRVEDLPDLPWSWVQHLSRMTSGTTSRAAGDQELEQFWAACQRADQPGYLSVIVTHFTDQVALGHSRHDSMQHCLTWAMEMALAGIFLPEPALLGLGAVWEQVHDDPRRAQLGDEHRTTEYVAMLRHAVGKALAKTPEELKVLHHKVAGFPMIEGSIPAEPKPVDDSDLPAPIHWATFADREEQANQWLVPDFWPWGRSLALWADAKAGKSELALWCAAHLAIGIHPWTGTPITPVRVAYFDYEMTPDDLDDRLSAFAIDVGKLDNLVYFQLPRGLDRLDVAKGGEQVERLVVRHKVRAVVIDTFSRAVDGDENDADTVRAFYRHTGMRLKALDIGVLRTDHAGKDAKKGQRGSSAKRDDVDVIWRMTRTASGLLLDSKGGSRLSWVPEQLKVTRTDTDDRVTYSREHKFLWSAAALDLAKQLDALGAPLAISRRQARQILVDAGQVAGRNATVGEAIEYRRQRSGTTSGTTTYPQGGDQ